MVVGFIIRALREDPLPMSMFGMYFQKDKIICVFVESTPTRYIIATPPYRWVGYDLISIFLTLF
jgi:hypothetical protein